MATYVIGDVQGCHDELRALCDKLRFDPAADRLWFTGDLVNRGPRSLEVLRFVRSLGDRAVAVLGNHDLHLVAAALSGKRRPKDTFRDVLDAPDREEWVQWLRRQPLLHVGQGAVLVHAGLPPQWTLAQARRLCAEAEARIRDPGSEVFFTRHMYGDEPRRWAAGLRGWARLRFIINCCTRIRFCTTDGRTEFDSKGGPERAGPQLVPWFAARGRRSAGSLVLFGHWSLLGRVHWPEHGVYGLDTGCVWGGRLTALNLQTRELTQVASRR